MDVLIACEFSGRVRDAFIARGHNAMSVDLEPSDSRYGPHYRGDMFDLLPGSWELVIAFPPCTYLARSGAHLYWGTPQQAGALEFVRRIMAEPVPKLAIENPVGAINSKIRQPNQIVQPWQFGHGDTKATCLWLRGLPELTPTRIVSGRSASILNAPGKGAQRRRNRSVTYQGLADAMAAQWGV